MTEASTGLRKALARGQKGTVLALSEMSADELLATLTDEQKAEMTAKLSAAAPAAAPAPAATASDDKDEDDAEEMAGDKKKSKSKEKDGDEYMEGDDAEAGAKAATERAVAVMSSEHAAGRTKLAADLLANDKLSADEIISILSASAPAAPSDPEAAARDEMKAVLKDAGNSGIEANNGGTVPAAAAAGSIWDKSYAKLGLTKPAA